MLGKHFALLGSTGTGKSTSAALILHRICDMAPQGHIVMIDPHGEYSAAFKTNGAIYDVGNLAMPYWLMNFEEHCEVFVTRAKAANISSIATYWPSACSPRAPRTERPKASPS
jgi:ABC-type multidrug transport system ATPase subunit